MATETSDDTGDCYLSDGTWFSVPLCETCGYTAHTCECDECECDHGESYANLEAAS